MNIDEAIEHSESMPLFPTLVWKAYLKKKVYQPLNKKLAAKVDALKGAEFELPPSRTWQTEQNLHEAEEFSELMSYVSTMSKSILDFTKIVYDDFRITGCWANIAAKGGSHIAHTHPNNYLSGVYYVQTQKGANHIVFDDPRSQRSVISPRVSELNETNANKVILPVEEGLLLVFPSWLVHSVGFNTSDKERISVSFNIMFSAFGETMSYPKWRPDMRKHGQNH
jgi:uncharacterized protein (TIGR02466 family)